MAQTSKREARLWAVKPKLNISPNHLKIVASQIKQVNQSTNDSVATQAGGNSGRDFESRRATQTRVAWQPGHKHPTHIPYGLWANFGWSGRQYKNPRTQSSNYGSYFASSEHPQLRQTCWGKMIMATQASVATQAVATQANGNSDRWQLRPWHLRPMTTQVGGNSGQWQLRPVATKANTVWILNKRWLKCRFTNGEGKGK